MRNFLRLQFAMSKFTSSNDEEQLLKEPVYVRLLKG